jgi:N-hydroxyarylamine O-acetyltransferase
VLQAHDGAEDDRGKDDRAKDDWAMDDWADQYAFTLEPFEEPDFEVINWHIGTNPRSPFTQRLYVQSVTAERHLLLDDRLLTDTRVDGTVVEREVTEEAEARRLLDEEFGIDVPEGMRLLRGAAG